MFGMTVPLFAEKVHRTKIRFFNKIQLLIIYIFQKQIKEDHSKRSKVDDLHLLRTRLSE